MTRRYGAFLGGLLLMAGCLTDPAQTQTSEIEQGLKDCNAGGNFPYAVMPAQPWWNGAQPPAPNFKSGYVAFMDAGATYWNVLLADVGQGQITYAVKVQPYDFGYFMYKIGTYGRFDVGRNPPPPPPDGGDWNRIARFGLEYEFRIQQVHDWSMTASLPVGP